MLSEHGKDAPNDRNQRRDDIGKGQKVTLEFVAPICPNKKQKKIILNSYNYLGGKEHLLFDFSIARKSAGPEFFTNGGGLLILPSLF